MAYITPKTDWEATDPITAADYNRIKNNLVYLNDLFNSMYPNPYTFNPGPDMEIDQMFKASTWNMFEDCVEHFKRSGRSYDFGERSYYHDNGHLPDYNQLNRLERCIEAYADTDIPVTGVSITTASYTDTIRYSQLPSSNRYQFIANVIPANASNKNITWSSSNTNVATIDSDGKVSAVGGGQTTITVTTEDGGYTATATYYLIISAESLTIDTFIVPSSWNAIVEECVCVEDYIHYNEHANYVRIECISSDTNKMRFIESNGKHYVYGYCNSTEVDYQRTATLTVKLYQDVSGTSTTPSYTASKSLSIITAVTNITDNTDYYTGGVTNPQKTVYCYLNNGEVPIPLFNSSQSSLFVWSLTDGSHCNILSSGIDQDGSPYAIIQGANLGNQIYTTHLKLKFVPNNTTYTFTGTIYIVANQ